jgi:terminase large subunit-like protein
MREMTIDRALADRRLLGAALDDLATWRVWFVILRAAFGLGLSAEELALFHSVAGDRPPPPRRVRELWVVAGRRSGKSRVAAGLACFIALFTRHKLAAGERGMVLVLAASIEQAKVVFGYCRAFLTASPVLAKEIADTTASEIRLSNGIVIAVHSNSFRTSRGRTLCGCIFDEVSFWRDETSSQPDHEVYSAVLPSLAHTNGLLVGISTPYRKHGLLHAKYKAHFGRSEGEGDTLVVRGDSKRFNPTLDGAMIAAQRAADPAAAASEWDAQWRTDVCGFVDRAAIEACVEPGVYERAPVNGTRYFSFTDPSGGSSDSMVCAVGHLDDGDVLVVDALREIKSPFDPESAVEEIAQLLALYQVNMTKGDRYSGQWCAQSFEKRSISYELAEQNKSQLYVELLPRINAKTIRLLDHPRAINQICMLERRTVRGGRDSIDHPSNTHDDLANAIAGLCGCTWRKYAYDCSMSWVS